MTQYVEISKGMWVDLGLYDHMFDLNHFLTSLSIFMHKTWSGRWRIAIQFPGPGMAIGVFSSKDEATKVMTVLALYGCKIADRLEPEDGNVSTQ